MGGCIELLHIYSIQRLSFNVVWLGSGPGVQKVESFISGSSGWNCPTQCVHGIVKGSSNIAAKP